jgi:2-polyprenyl-3-methyl-5-hydroxy-6-metoxy-1,4-benzoquinol methylase
MYYHEKTTGYFKNARIDLLSLLPDNPDAKLLEVGAAGGYTLVAAKEMGKCGYCAGIELFDIPDAAQDHSCIDAFHIGNIETGTFPFAGETFDVIMFPDVLEHLTDPWGILQKCIQWLKPGGVCLISIPNFQYWKVGLKVFLSGDFAYTNEGILDKTHLRFFCKPNAMALAGLEPLVLEKVYSSFDLQDQKKLRWVNFLTCGLLRQFLSIQYITVSRKRV